MKNAVIPQLFTEILVPLGVLEEVTTKDDVASTQLPNISWIQTVKVNTIASEVAGSVFGAAGFIYGDYLFTFYFLLFTS